jgi:peroxiredoxin
MKLLTLFLLMLCFLSEAQVVQNFELTNAVDGKTVSLKDYSTMPAVVIIFSTNNCPYSEYYINRLLNLIEAYKNKIPVLLINSSKEENESVQSMTDYAAQRKLLAPYLADKEQKVLESLNPRKSPESFLLQNASGKFSIAYRGAIDDNPQSATEVKYSYLQQAMDKILTGQKIDTPDVRPVGCTIKKN